MAILRLSVILLPDDLFMAGKLNNQLPQFCSIAGVPPEREAMSSEIPEVGPRFNLLSKVAVSLSP